MNNGTTVTIDNPALYPDPTLINITREPYIKARFSCRIVTWGAVMKLCLDRRGINKNYQYLTSNRWRCCSELPLAEVIYDFLRPSFKSITQGYGSF